MRCFLILTGFVGMVAGWVVAEGPAATQAAGEFRDAFKKELGPGWSWVREDRTGWRFTDKGLEVRPMPGNMWGPANNARNLLVREAPDPAKGEVDVRVTMTNTPTEQYEQADLVWYYDDSTQVKCGQELVNGKLVVVMGREEKDRPRTIKILPLESATVTLRLVVKGNQITGMFKTPRDTEWTTAGTCDVPAGKGTPKVCLQFYQGPRTEGRWVGVADFVMMWK